MLSRLPDDARCLYVEGGTPWGWDREMLAAIYDRLGVIATNEIGFGSVPEPLTRPNAALAPRRPGAPARRTNGTGATMPPGETTGSALSKIAAKGRALA